MGGCRTTRVYDQLTAREYSTSSPALPPRALDVRPRIDDLLNIDHLAEYARLPYTCCSGAEAASRPARRDHRPRYCCSTNRPRTRPRSRVELRDILRGLRWRPAVLCQPILASRGDRRPRLLVSGVQTIGEHTMADLNGQAGWAPVRATDPAVLAPAFPPRTGAADLASAPHHAGGTNSDRCHRTRRRPAAALIAAASGWSRSSPWQNLESATWQ